MKLEYQQCPALETMRIEVETKSWVENMEKFCSGDVGVPAMPFRNETTNGIV
jgi:hypothetical protein